MEHYNKSRESFIEFLRYGLKIKLIPGAFAFKQVLEMFNLPRDISFPGFGVTCAWFQDIHFFFDDNGILLSFQLRLNSIDNSMQKMPKALDIVWREFAADLTPEMFEDLVLLERIPCLKAATIMGEPIYPAIYCLDHLGLMPRFSDSFPHKLEYITVRLIRNFPILDYKSIWPPSESEYHLLFDLPPKS